MFLALVTLMGVSAKIKFGDETLLPCGCSGVPCGDAGPIVRCRITQADPQCLEGDHSVEQIYSFSVSDFPADPLQIELRKIEKLAQPGRRIRLRD